MARPMEEVQREATNVVRTVTPFDGYEVVASCSKQETLQLQLDFFLNATSSRTVPYVAKEIFLPGIAVIPPVVESSESFAAPTALKKEGVTWLSIQNAFPRISGMF